MEIIITTKSDKYNNWCVAGISTDNGRWIRPVRMGADDSLTDANLTCTNGHIAEVLDVIEIDIAPGNAVALHPHQVENVFMDTTVSPRFVRRSTWNEVFALHAPKRRNMILNNNTKTVYGSDKMPATYVDQLVNKKSIQLAKIRNLKINACAPGKNHPKADFDYLSAKGEVLHYKLTVTDPEYAHNASRIDHTDAHVIVSLAGEPYRGNCYYLLAAKIIPPEMRITAATSGLQTGGADPFEEPVH